MFQRILVPLSGFPRSEFVTPIAARLARSAGGEITLLRVTSGPGGASPREFAEWEKRYAAAMDYLSRIAAREEFAGLQTSISVREGPAISEILAAAASASADLIILGRQGRSGEPGQARERLAERVTRDATASVLLIREPQSPLTRMRAGQTCALRILIPLDGSLLAETALLPAAELLEALGDPEGSGLHLSRIIPDERMWRESARYLAHVAEQVRAGALMGRPFNVTWSVIPHVDPAGALIRVAEMGESSDELTTWSVARDLGRPREGATTPAQSPARGADFHHCDLIGLTTHGHGGLRRMILGSVAERLLRDTTVSLLLVRRTPDEAQAPLLTREPDVEQWRA